MRSGLKIRVSFSLEPLYQFSDIGSVWEETLGAMQIIALHVDVIWIWIQLE